ncbi:hypothetical protein NDU88_006601 [Pleurodeles waltl]|uniref:Uncharacterized protein n=1 Tax=Pleurodeles waltl TaxID=8319 RepID=A0AAV7SQ47_PLEWA|nr:hypothetical protein NDU88_006601 [Pleurodeles waltl]
MRPEPGAAAAAETVPRPLCSAPAMKHNPPCTDGPCVRSAKYSADIMQCQAAHSNHVAGKKQPTPPHLSCDRRSVFLMGWCARGMIRCNHRVSADVTAHPCCPCVTPTCHITQVPGGNRSARPQLTINSLYGVYRAAASQRPLLHNTQRPRESRPGLQRLTGAFVRQTPGRFL